MVNYHILVYQSLHFYINSAVNLIWGSPTGGVHVTKEWTHSSTADDHDLQDVRLEDSYIYHGKFAKFLVNIYRYKIKSYVHDSYSNCLVNTQGVALRYGCSLIRTALPFNMWRLFIWHFVILKTHHDGQTCLEWTISLCKRGAPKTSLNVSRKSGTGKKR